MQIIDSAEASLTLLLCMSHIAKVVTFKVVYELLLLN